MNKPKLYIPLIGNGGGEGKMTWTASMIAGLNGCNVHLDLINDSHPNRAMNRAAASFLATDCDEWINIDADIEFTPEHLQRLLSHDVDLVYGIYPKKDDKTEPCLCTWPDGPRMRDDGLIEIKRAGRGFMRVRRALLERMKEESGGPALRFHNHGRTEWDFFPSGPVRSPNEDDALAREWLSEDWYFCDRSYALGTIVLCDPKIVLAHEGSKIYRFGDSQIAAEKPEVKSWRDIPGWFDFEDFYRWLADQIPAGGSFVEIGVFMGKSLFAMEEFTIQKGISVGAVDTFQGTPGDEEQAKLIEMAGGNLYVAFAHNIKALKSRVGVMNADSSSAAANFPRFHFDAVFIDGDHSARGVIRDIVAWEPKVKSGGILAGHDYDEPGVQAAVKAMFAESEIATMGRCWYYKKP